MERTGTMSTKYRIRNTQTASSKLTVTYTADTEAEAQEELENLQRWFCEEHWVLEPVETMPIYQHSPKSVYSKYTELYTQHKKMWGTLTNT